MREEESFIVVYYRQLSADIKMKNFMIKTSFVTADGPYTLADETGFYFDIRGKLSVIRCYEFSAENRF